MGTIPVLDKAGKAKDKVQISDEIFGKHVNAAVLHQAVVMYQACLRQGTASTKERADVSGGGKKPYRQKGTGRARVGSSRSPLWIGGGVTFGPHPRDFSYTLPKKIKKVALRESINAKIKDEKFIFVGELKDKFNKTKEFAQVLKALNIQGKTLAILDGSDDSIKLASRNIPRFSLKRAEDVNAYDVLRNKNVLLTKTAFEILLKRVT